MISYYKIFYKDKLFICKRGINKLKRISIFIALLLVLLCGSFQQVFAEEELVFTKLQCILGSGIPEDGTIPLRAGVMIFSSNFPIRARMGIEHRGITGVRSDWVYDSQQDKNIYKEKTVQELYNGLFFDMGVNYTYRNKATFYLMAGVGYEIGVNEAVLRGVGGLEYHLNDKVSLFAEMDVFSGTIFDFDEYDNTSIFVGINYGWTSWNLKTATDSYYYDRRLETNVIRHNKLWGAVEFDVSQLTMGMTKGEVKRLWGSPYSIEEHDEFTTWDYYEQDEISFVQSLINHPLSNDYKYIGCTLYFEGDILIDWTEYEYVK